MVKLAFLISLCSKNQDWTKCEHIDLFNDFMNGLMETLSFKHKYIFYLGYDENDEFIKGQIPNIEKRIPKDMLHIVELPVRCNGNPCEAWNILYKVALSDKENEYFYQCGSDIRHLNIRWDDYLIQLLKKNDNDGIVGGVEQNQWVNRTLHDQNGILENVMTTRKHFDRFGWFFPPEVKSWYSDDMITRIYLNLGKCLICPNIQYINTNRVGGHNEKSRYVPPEKEEIAKTWKSIADTYSEKCL